jgi:serine protease
VLRHRIGLGAVGLSAIAAIASVALPAAIAQSSVKLTAKQAAMLGLPAPAQAASEEMVGALIVKMRATGSQLAQAQGGAYVRSLSNMAGVGVKGVRAISDSASHVTLDGPMTLSEARAVAARLASDPMVEYAEPDVAMRPFAVPNEADFVTKQWNLYPPASIYPGNVTVAMGQPAKTTSAPAAGAANLITAWDRTKGSDTVVVAVIDTGIVNHPDLNNAGLATPLTYVPGGRFLPGYDFVSSDALAPLALNFVSNDGNGRDNDPADPGDQVSAAERANVACNDNTPNQQNVAAPSTWHGTHSAGVVAATADNAAGIAGIGWNIKVVPVRALGKCGGAMSDVADAIKWAAGVAVTTLPVPVPAASANPAKVILVGAGGKVGVACSQTLQSAIDAAVGAGSVIVAAAGNEGSLIGISAPANCNNVIAVTAHAINGENASYSNIDAVGGSQVSISAAGGGSPSGLGGLGPIDDPLWDGYYIWSTTSSGTAGPVANAPTAAYTNRFGTSPAAAQVAGVAALIKSATTPPATPAQIKSAIMTSARPFPELSSCAPGRIFAGRCGAGMLDATRALQAAGPPFVVTPPASVTVAAGATASFAIEAIGAESYQWIRAGVAIAGATGPTYTTPPLAATDNNVAFQVNMSNSFGGTTSTAAVLTVTGGASNSPSGGGALPTWQLLLLSALLLAARFRVAYREQ